jgi:tetratricopeptide (TPR) repeat protein
MWRKTLVSLNSVLTLAFLMAFAPASARAQEGKRVALVIGNNTYALSPLRNAVADARILDQALRNAGFKTILRENVTLAALQEAVSEFLLQLGPDDTALFFYAGHGIQIENENFLIPVDFAAANSVIQAKYKTFSMAPFLADLQNRPKRTIIILDACRTNPVAQSQALEAGLAQPQKAGKGTYFAYSTQPGQVAADNPNGRNSWFTEALADQIAQRGLDLDEVFTRVRSRVLSETEGKQLSWTTNTQIGKFYFYPPSDIDSAADPTLAEKWMSEARLREQREDWDEAIHLLEQVLQKKTGGTLELIASRKLPYLKARSDAEVRYEKSEFAEAAGLDKQALQLDPFALDAAFQEATALLLADRLPDAVRVLQEIRVRGTTASLDRANAMLKQLAAVEPEAGKALEAGIPQPPPVEEVLSGVRFHVPDFEAGDRYLASTPVDLIHWSKEVTAAMTPPAPPPAAAPPTPVDALPPPADSPAQQLAALSEAELKVAQAFLHVEIIPATRDIAIHRIKSAEGEPSAPPSGFVEFQGTQAQTFVLMDGRALARQVPSRVPLPVGKYEIKTVEGSDVLSQQTVEITADGVFTLIVRGRQ